MNILFVCLGNICRSPMAEGVFGHLVKEKGLSGSFFIESAGTASYHIGETADPRTLQILKENGISLGSTARQVAQEDFTSFDYILAMDHDNLNNLMRIAPKTTTASVQLFRDFDPQPENGEVPDPYYGGINGFRNVFEMVERTGRAFLEHLQSAHNIS